MKQLLSIGIFVIAVVIGYASIQSRTAAVLDSTDELVDDTKEVLSLLKSVHNPASARAATPRLEQAYQAVVAGARKVVDSAKSADRRGGATEEGLRKFNEKVAVFASTMKQIGDENERLQGIRGLPLEFWNTVRRESVSWLKVSVEISGSRFSREQKAYFSDCGQLMDEYGPERVVMVVAPLMTSNQLENTASQLKAKLGGGATSAQMSFGDHTSIMVGPIDNFEKFVAEIDCGQVVENDPGQRMIVLEPGGAPVAVGGPRANSIIPNFTDRGARGFPSSSSPAARALGASGGMPPSPPSGSDRMAAKYGQDRVVVVEVANFLDVTQQMHQAAAALASVRPEIESCELSAARVRVAPVDDFNAFCQSLDFAEIVERNDAEKSLKINVDSAKLAAGSRDLARRVAEKFGGRNSEMIERMLSMGAPDGPDGLPNPSDPNYHKTLCELMDSKVKWTLNEPAIDALLGLDPRDIGDTEVRKQIARNFRELAAAHGHSHNKSKAFRGLALYGGSYSIPILIEALDSERLEAPSGLFEALASFPDSECAEAICRKLGNHFNHDSAVAALRSMGAIAEDALIKTAPTNDATISIAAVELLGEVGTNKSLDLLEKATRSSNSDVRKAAQAATDAITSRSKKPAQ